MTIDEAIATVRPYSALTPERLRVMVGLCKDLPLGCVVQCGVGMGGSGALLGWATRQPLWLFDRFAGIPKPGPEDGDRANAKWHKEWWATRLSFTASVIGELGLAPNNVRIIGGDFSETFRLVKTGPIAFLHLDADWYASTKLCLERWMPDMSPGGMVVVDDYNCWPGCKKAIDEWNEKRGLELHHIDNAAAWFRMGVQW